MRNSKSKAARTFLLRLQAVMRRVSVTRLLLVAVLLAAGCRAPTPEDSLQRYQFTEPGMGTLFTITLYAPNEVIAEGAAYGAFQRITELNHVMSDYDPDSELMELCQQSAGKPVRVSDELFAVLKRSQEIAKDTEGTFDVTAGRMVRLWREAKRTGKLPSADNIAAARKIAGWRKVQLDPRKKTVTLTVSGMQLDLGGIGKGWAADEALRVLRRHGITRALVAASGDIAVGDPPPGRDGWVIGVGAVDGGRDDLVRQVVLRNCGVSTSGDTEQFVEIDGMRYSHIVDPETGVGLTNRIQATVIAPDATTSDSHATAVCVMGTERGMEFVESRRGLEALIITVESGDAEVRQSRGFEKWILNQGR